MLMNYSSGLPALIKKTHFSCDNFVPFCSSFCVKFADISLEFPFVIIGGSKGGARDARPLHPIFFLQFSEKIDQNNRLVPPRLGLAPPPLGNPGSATSYHIVPDHKRKCSLRKNMSAIPYRFNGPNSFSDSNGLLWDIYCVISGELFCGYWIKMSQINFLRQ